MVVQTSLLAFEEIKMNGVMETQRNIILNFFVINKYKCFNDKMLSYYLALPINVITARRNELEAKGVIKFCKYDKCPFSNKLTKFYEVKI